MVKLDHQRAKYWLSVSSRRHRRAARCNHGLHNTACRCLQVGAQPTDAVARCGHPTAWTILQHDGPNHLGLWHNALPDHQMALTTSGCAPSSLLAAADLVPKPPVRDSTKTKAAAAAKAAEEAEDE